jgi:hypothetical protein
MRVLQRTRRRPRATRCQPLHTHTVSIELAPLLLEPWKSRSSSRRHSSLRRLAARPPLFSLPCPPPLLHPELILGLVGAHTGVGQIFSLSNEVGPPLPHAKRGERGGTHGGWLAMTMVGACVQELEGVAEAHNKTSSGGGQEAETDTETEEGEELDVRLEEDLNNACSIACGSAHVAVATGISTSTLVVATTTAARSHAHASSSLRRACIATSQTMAPCTPTAAVVLGASPSRSSASPLRTHSPTHTHTRTHTRTCITALAQHAPTDNWDMETGRMSMCHRWWRLCGSTTSPWSPVAGTHRPRVVSNTNPVWCGCPMPQH